MYLGTFYFLALALFLLGLSSCISNQYHWITLTYLDEYVWVIFWTEVIFVFIFIITFIFFAFSMHNLNIFRVFSVLSFFYWLFLNCIILKFTLIKKGYLMLVTQLLFLVHQVYHRLLQNLFRQVFFLELRFFLFLLINFIDRYILLLWGRNLSISIIRIQVYVFFLHIVCKFDAILPPSDPWSFWHWSINLL